MAIFIDRTQAGNLLSAKLQELNLDWQNTVLFALPRGGIVVAEPIAQKFKKIIIPLMVRKIGAPGNKEFAIGALAEENEVLINNEIIKAHNFEWKDIENILDEEREELKRRLKTYRDGKPIPNIKGKTAIIIDDGLATGATMKVCCQLLRKKQPEQIIVAVPVASQDALIILSGLIDRAIYVAVPHYFIAIGQHYHKFPQNTDTEVLQILEKNKNMVEYKT